MVRNFQAKQDGVALIMALLIVALVTTVVVEISWRFNLSMARNENRWHGVQARSYLESGEQAALEMLKLDAEKTPTDHLGEEWAQSHTVPIDEGWIRGELEDAHSRFNLNLLVPPKVLPLQPGQPPPPPPATPADAYSEAQKRFIRFLQTIKLEKGQMIDQQKALEIVAAIADWIDQDSNVTQGPMGEAGAEGSDYEGANPPIVISNDYMTSVSELALVKGVTPEIFKKLEPYVVALPPDGFSMNINTMRPEVLRAFNVKNEFLPLDEAVVGALVKIRNEKQVATKENPNPAGFAAVSEITNELITSGLPVNAADFSLEGLDVISHYFIFHGETLVGEQVRRSTSLLFRQSASQVEVVRRTDSNF